MSGSNSEWGELAAHDTELADLWDTYAPLPDPGSNQVLDKFVESKQIDISALVRVGARLSDADVLVFAFPGGLKFRDMTTGKRWNYFGSEFKHLKIVRAGPSPTEKVIVCEGETDAARLSMLYDVDVAVLPAGARRFTSEFASDLEGYDHVLVGLDADEAGEAGSNKILEALPSAERFPPPAVDWCEADHAPELPTQITRAELPDLVFGPQLAEYETPDIASWFEHALLPVGGQLLLHGWKASFKSWMGLDMMKALVSGDSWAGFEPTEEPCRVAVVQAEIPWTYLKDRLHTLGVLDNPNFAVWQPDRRPELAAGNRKHEDPILQALVDNEVQVVMFDPVRRFMGGGDMNSEQDVRKLLAFYERLNREGITVVFVHHDNKDSRKAGADIANTTGSGALVGDPDSVVSITLPPKHELADPVRNLHFTIRNGPPVGDRSMQLAENGHIIYDTEPIYERQETTDGQPSI